MRMKNSSYTYALPRKATFEGKGLQGYTFGPLRQKDVEVLYVESERGHDTFLISRKVSRTYYILDGNGYFTVDDERHHVSIGMLVEIPPGVEYSYSGKMTLLVFCKPLWSRGNDIFTKWNTDVMGGEFKGGKDHASGWKRLVGLRIFGKSPANAYLRINQRMWKMLPSSFTARAPIHLYGRFLHALARMQDARAQAFSTFFLRNRPQLELIGRLVGMRDKSDTLRIAVLGCSAGAEAYSIAWRIRSARPELKFVMHAMDISREAVEWAKCGVYSLKAQKRGRRVRDCMGAGRWALGEADSPLVGAEVFERVSPVEMDEFFEKTGDAMTVRPWIKEGINWHVGDVREKKIVETIGLQDMVVANNFLCHMEEAAAEECLRNIARLVNLDGYLFVSGVDLDVKTRVAREMGWEPVEELIEEIHDGDSCVRADWPCGYAGLEPLDKRRRDWRIRYATAFRLTSENAVRRPCTSDSTYTLASREDVFL
jgi:chemotaxis methyl-accepting protein methylase